MELKDTKNIKILVVEDDEIARENEVEYLQEYFENIYEAKDAFEAFEIVESKKPHIVITDINMPKMNGLDMVKKIREKDINTKIIVLSAYTKTQYLLDAVELGLEKYLVKPIRHETLFPILNNCINKIKNNNANLKFFSENCFFDIFNKQLFKNDVEIKLTNKEVDFLTLLCERKNQTVSYNLIQEIVWQNDFMSEDAIRSVARNLRKKVPENCLENVSKIGYKIITLD